MDIGPDQKKRVRDYTRETALRKARNKRLLADIEKEKAERFTESLSARGLTFTAWLNDKIEEELK